MISVDTDNVSKLDVLLAHYKYYRLCTLSQANSYNNSSDYKNKKIANWQRHIVDKFNYDIISV